MSNFSLKDALLHPLSAHFYKEKIVALDYLYKNDSNDYFYNEILTGLYPNWNLLFIM